MKQFYKDRFQGDSLLGACGRETGADVGAIAKVDAKRRAVPIPPITSCTSMKKQLEEADLIVLNKATLFLATNFPR